MASTAELVAAELAELSAEVKRCDPIGVPRFVLYELLELADAYLGEYHDDRGCAVAYYVQDLLTPPPARPI